MAQSAVPLRGRSRLSPKEDSADTHHVKKFRPISLTRAWGTVGLNVAYSGDRNALPMRPINEVFENE